MKEHLQAAIDLMKSQGASYADCRLVETRDESITVRNKVVESLSRSSTRGVGVRAIVDGAWGFAASNILTGDEIMRVARRAMDVARASAITKTEDVVLSEEEPHVDKYSSEWKEHPEDVGLGEKIDLLVRCTEGMMTKPEIKVAEGYMHFWFTDKTFLSTEGHDIEQTIVESGGGMQATAVKDGEMQRRSYPNSFRGDYGTRGYELIREMELEKNVDRVRDEAVMILNADECPAGKRDIIIEGSQLALQVHESLGHPAELDRAFGTEISLAGGSFLRPEMLGTNYRYGSDLCNIVADSTVPGGLGTFGYDDEGVKACRAFCIEKGIFVGYLMSRETAAKLGLKSNACMRAHGWWSIPLIRMVNVNLEPGKGSFDDLIADTKDGLLFDTNKSWSIDDKRLNFQFATELVWEIKDGKKVKPYKNGLYTGITPEFWGSLVAVSGPEEWHVWGVPNCGKGEPMQSAHVAHGTSPSKFKNINVGVAQ